MTDLERLAVLETKVESLTVEIRSLRESVDRLVLTEELRQGKEKSRADLGVWVRWSPALLALGLSIFNIMWVLVEHFGAN